MGGSEFKDYLGVGIYSPREASELSGVSVARIRRWLSGYSYESNGKRQSSTPVWSGQLPRLDGQIALSFLDLIEVRFISAFLDAGVRWKMIRTAERLAADRYGATHPFAMLRFKTDGRDIFMEAQGQTRREALVDVVRNQRAFRKVIEPYLKDLDFGESKQVLRWWPVDGKRFVVIDPTRSFGQPIVTEKGIPTAILYRAYRAEGSYKAVASWYDVGARSVRAAVAFEESLAERRAA